MAGRTLTMAALLAAVALSPLAAQAKADFSGSWKMNMEKSDPMGGGMGGGGMGGSGMGGGGMGMGMAMPVTIITQTAAKLTLETKMGENTRTLSYLLDGSESVNPGARGGDSKSKVQWDGSSLVIHTESTFTGPNGAMTVTSKEVRSLSADGKIMTVVATRTTPNGEQTTRRVYDKQ